MHSLISAFSSVHTRMTDTRNKKQQLKVFPATADDTADTCYAFIREEVVSGPVYLIFFSRVFRLRIATNWTVLVSTPGMGKQLSLLRNRPDNPLDPPSHLFHG